MAAPEGGVIALQHLAGNHAVSALVAREPSFGLYDDEEKAALKLINDTMRLDDASVRTLQSLIGAPLTGTFTYKDARSLSHFRVRHGMKRSGLLTRGVLETMLADLVAAGRENEAVHLIANASGLMRDKDILSLRFDASLTTASAQTVGPSQLRVMTVGPSALKDVKSLQDAIKARLATGPGPLMPVATPVILTDEEAEGAAAENQGVLRDRRSVLAIQTLLTAPQTGTFDAATARFIANAQQGRPAGRKDGVIDEAFIHFVIERLSAPGSPAGIGTDRDALIRVVVDYFRIDETGVADVVFDSSLFDEFVVEGGKGGTPATLKFGPRAFGAFATSIDPAAIAQTIARGYAAVRRP